jgi:endonuclease G, mitochondrial
MSRRKSEKVTSFLEWIAPKEGLESRAEEPEVLRGIEEIEWSTEAEVERAVAAVGRLERNESVADEHIDALEAIILPKERPVVDIVNGTYATPASPFQHLGQSAARVTIETAIPSVGRIELPNHPSLPYGGTGFVVGENLLMTNRHVAELFAVGIGRDELSFRSGQTAAIDFLRERDWQDSLTFGIARVVMIHPYWDAALLLSDGLGAVPPLKLSVAPPGDLRESEIAVIGYPALDPRNNVELQNRIFGGIFNIKRLQPGKLREQSDITSFGHGVSAVMHDSSTLGGNSGSAVIDISNGTVVALHFAGRYLEANYAVPTHELALDRRVVEAGVNFEGELGDAGAPQWDSFWSAADPQRQPSELVTASRQRESSTRVESQEQALSWSIPLEVSIQIRSRAATPSTAPTAAEAGMEALVEPFRDEDFTGRSGYDDRFLGIPVPLPAVADPSVLAKLDDGSHVLPYEHFSIVLDRGRRLALFTASNVDADPARKQPEPGRDYTREGLTGLGENDQEKWFTDPRIPAVDQLPDRFFTKDRKAFDKGHIVRREDVAWGDTYDEVRRANGDTFHVTNCSPQVAHFNRSAKQGVWGLLENLILRQAKAERYSLFTGPLFRPDDPIFRGIDDVGPVGVAIPRRFWKIVVARSGAGLQTFAFILEQDLSATPFEEFAVDAEWKSRMISVPDLEQLVGRFSFPAELHRSDQIGKAGGEAVRAEAGVETISG